MKNLGICVAVSVITWFAPSPAGVTAQAWHLLAIFLGTIVGIITKPMPLGAVAMLGLGASMVTGVLPFAAAFSAFSSEIPWLIAIAFWLSGGFIKSGLGSRIAYGIVSLFGSTTLGLTYSLVFAEALLAPAIPSVAARAGGIFFPLAKALCLACGSDPKNGTEARMGAYVMKTLFQTSCVSSAMFITAMAANPLAVNLAADALGTTISWGTWALAGLVPGLVCLVSVPAILYVIYPPQVKDTPDAPAKAREELKKLGPLSTDEKITAGALATTVALWIFGAGIGINAVAAALVGLAILLITNVVTWKECLSDNQAWDTLTWFAALIGMVGEGGGGGRVGGGMRLRMNGFGPARRPPTPPPPPPPPPLRPPTSTSTASSSGSPTRSWALSPGSASRGRCDEGGARRGRARAPALCPTSHPAPPPQAAFGVITLLYFYSHYLFASGAAHIGAMYTAFLSVATACGTPGMLAAVALGQLSNLMGCLTTYGIGSAPPYFGAGYVPQAKWYQLGLLLSVFYLAVWLGVGGAWWKVIGLY